MLLFAFSKFKISFLWFKTRPNPRTLLNTVSTFVIGPIAEQCTFQDDISILVTKKKRICLFAPNRASLKLHCFPQLKIYRILFPLIKYRLKWGGHATRKNALCPNVRIWLKCLISYWKFNGVPEIHLSINYKEHLVENPCHAPTHARPLHPTRCLWPHL